jgi:polar amino acid transport system substrate-binding protein
LLQEVALKTFGKSLLIGVILAMLASSPAAADIRIGVAAEPYAPFTSKDASGQWVGWEIEVMNALCAAMKEKCELVETAWDGIIPALTANKIDVIMSSMSITAKRKETISFSNAYYFSAAVLAGAKTGDMDITPEHLSGKTIGVQVSTIHAAYLDKYYAATATVKTYQTQDEVNQDLAAGRIDYVMANGIALDGFLKSDQGGCCEAKGIVPTDVAVLGEGVGAGIRKEDAALVEKFNTAISQLAAAGTFDAITAKYALTGQITTPAK